MRSWKPRRPSPPLEAQIFGTTPTSPGRLRPTAPHFLAWWQTLGATVAACLAVLVTLVNLNGMAGRTSGWAMPLSLSNDHAGATLAMAGSPVNTWASAPILGWTNAGHVESSMRSFDLLNTNRLLH